MRIDGAHELSSVEASLLRVQRRFGRTGLVVGTTVVSIALSCGLTFMALALTGMAEADRETVVIGMLLAFAVPAVVAPSVTLLTSQLINRLDVMTARLNTAATTDPLTGVLNRRGFFAALSGTGESNEAGGSRRISTVGMADLDRFKDLNDSFGHDVGDAALVAFAERLQVAVGDSAVVGRLGGDEFAFAIFEGDHTPDVDILRVTLGTVPVRPTLVFGATIGIAVIEEDEELSLALSRADAELYKAKRARTAAVDITEPMTPKR
jgi:diguanylate cyclase (GGDEF)-like protein